MKQVYCSAIYQQETLEPVERRAWRLIGDDKRESKLYSLGHRRKLHVCPFSSDYTYTSANVPMDSTNSFRPFFHRTFGRRARYHAYLVDILFRRTTLIYNNYNPGI